MLLFKITLFAVTIILLLSSISVEAADKVRLQLRWQHQFQFAGYYAALEKGYYRDAGLDVEIIPCNPDEDPVQKVLKGEAEFGVGSTELILLREQGTPVVVLAAIFQHSALALMTLEQSGIKDIRDIAGRKVMIEPGSSELYAYLRKEGLFPDKYILFPHHHQVKDLVTGKADAMSTYVTDEPFELKKAGKEYLLYSPLSAGIDFYGDNLFTIEKQIRLKPEMVKAFRAASLKGWEYAMQNPEELVQIIYSRYSRRHSVEHLRFEAREMVPLMETSLMEIGHMNPTRWRHIAEVYASLGMIKPNFDFNGFLYDPNAPPDLKWFYIVIAASATLVIVISLVAFRFSRLSATLKTAIEKSKQAELKLRDSIAEAQRFREALDHVPSYIYIKDIKFQYIYANLPTLELFGCSAEQLVGSDDTDFFPTETVNRLREIDSRVMMGARTAEEIDVAGQVGGRRVYWEFKTPVYDQADGRTILGLLGISTDITARKCAEESLEAANHKLAILSITDGLTGIANRRHFDRVLAQEYARHARSGDELSLVLMDIDQFKAYNDSYGHIKGDECLKQVAEVMAKCAARPADLSARYGGEEFACILPETDLNGAVSIAEKIRRSIISLAIPHNKSTVADCVTVSLGVVSEMCIQGGAAGEMLHKADEMLYRAKSCGRNRVEFVSDGNLVKTCDEELKKNLVRLRWKDSFCCGNQEIDSQHKSLFNQSNNLFEAMIKERPGTEIHEIITVLLDDISKHFQREEIILGAANFPGLTLHAAEHAKLISKGLSLAKQFNASNAVVGEVFHFLLHDVVMAHMLSADREYFPFIDGTD